MSSAHDWPMVDQALVQHLEDWAGNMVPNFSKITTPDEAFQAIQTLKGVWSVIAKLKAISQEQRNVPPTVKARSTGSSHPGEER